MLWLWWSLLCVVVVLLLWLALTELRESYEPIDIAVLLEIEREELDPQYQVPVCCCRVLWLCAVVVVVVVAECVVAVVCGCCCRVCCGCCYPVVVVVDVCDTL